MTHDVNRAYLAPGPEWPWGTIDQPIQVPEAPGPFRFEEDAELLRWWLSFVVHVEGMARFYGLLGDHPQRMRAVEALGAARAVVQKLYGWDAWRNLQALASSLAAGEVLTAAQSQEAGWLIHALYCIRRLEIAWVTNSVRYHREVTRAREKVARMIQCSLPEDFARELLSEDVCAWSKDRGLEAS